MPLLFIYLICFILDIFYLDYCMLELKKQFCEIFILLFINISLFSVHILPYGKTQKALEFIKSKKILPRNPKILDAGSYLGKESILMSQIWPDSTVYSFEPVPDIYSRLVFNTRKYKNIKTYNLALSNYTGTSEMILSQFPHSNTAALTSMSSSLRNPKKHLEYSKVKFNKKVIVPVTTLDNWAKENKVDHIDFLWLDLQGSELDVLKASPEILKKVRAIFIEVDFVEVYEGQPLYEEVRVWIELQGFEMIAKNFEKPLCPEWFGDCLFIRK